MDVRDYVFAEKGDGTVILVNRHAKDDPRYLPDQRKIEDWEIVALFKIFAKQKCDSLDAKGFSIVQDGKKVLNIQLED